MVTTYVAMAFRVNKVLLNYNKGSESKKKKRFVKVFRQNFLIEYE